MARRFNGGEVHIHLINGPGSSVVVNGMDISKWVSEVSVFRGSDGVLVATVDLMDVQVSGAGDS